MPAPSLTDKNTSILIIDESGTLRPVVGGIFRDLGYRNVFSLKSLSEFYSYPDRGEVTWILTHPYMNNNLTVFHLLRRCLEDKNLRDLRVTIFFDESESHLIPYAYCLGTLSHHLGTLTTNSIRADLKQVIQQAREGFADIAIAASFFREDLMNRQWFMDRLIVEQVLLEMTDQSSAQLLNTAEAYLLTGQEQMGVTNLYEAIMFDPKTEEQAEHLSQKYLKRPFKDNDNPVKRETCMVIDSDDTVRKQIVEILSNIHFKTVMEFEDGKTALEFARKYRDIDLIITEWKVKEISGPALVQIIRSELSGSIPLVICSSLIKEEDAILLVEIGINKVISKPIQSRNFIASIVSALKESQYPSELSSKEREFRLKLKDHEVDKAQTLLNSLLVDPKVPRGKKALLQGELKLHQDCYQEAKTLGIQASQILGYNTAVLNLLGKASLKLGEHEKALAFLEKANSLSPQNLERLCAIATEQAKLGDSVQAKSTIDKVVREAPTAAFTKEAQLSIAMSEGEHQEASNLLGNMDSTDSLISFWNSQAISYVKKQEFEKGIEIYRRALTNLPPGYSDNRSYIRYNLALAFARSNMLKEAAIYLEVESAMKHSPVFKKAVSLLKKVSHSIKSGEPLELKGAMIVEQKVASDIHNFTASIQSNILPGRRCLWGLYTPEHPLPKELIPIFVEDELEEDEAV